MHRRNVVCRFLFGSPLPRLDGDCGNDSVTIDTANTRRYCATSFFKVRHGTG